MSALNSVSENYSLGLHQKQTSDLEVGGDAQSGFDRFWGSMNVALRPGVEVPIPSVAAESRILSYEVTPKTALVFSKDAADNYFVRGAEGTVKGQYRVVFVIEAPASYFAPSVPNELKVSEIPPTHLSPMPQEVQSTAKRVLKALGLTRRMKAKDALNTLTMYFRAFDAKSPPPDSGNIYWDLFSSQAGVCRHRSYAFMITANALGIPTRYLTNEAHAWVEVWLPETQWFRIDLGGAANTLNVANASDKAMYKPRGEDPFDKPKSYEENYTRLEGDIEGLRPEQIADRQSTYESPGEGGNVDGDFFDDDGELEGPQIGEALAGPGSSLPAIPEEEMAGRLPIQLFVNPLNDTAYLGDFLPVEAIVSTDDGEGVPGLQLDFFLAPARNDGNDAILLGRKLSDEQGKVEIDLEIPSDFLLKKYELYVSTPGSETYRPAVSE